MTRVGKIRLGERLSRLSDRRFKRILYSTALGLYLFGIWLHLPYGGGYVYTSITYLFQERVCQIFPPVEYGPLVLSCRFTIPYLQSFSEYPVLTSMFMYAMGRLGALFPGDLLRNSYLVSSAVLAVPTFLVIRDLVRLAEMKGTSRVRILWYFVVTPTFLIMTLLNWYIIGVYFMLSAIRMYLEGGSRLWTGVLFGLSAATNFITAVPAVGLLFATRTKKEMIILAGAAGGTYGLINAPFLVLNPGLWYQSWQYLYNWNIEDSWMGAILLNPYSPYRHVIPLVVFSAFLAGMLWMRHRKTTSDPLVFAFVAMFGYVLATYISPPQLSLTLLPFFVLLPVAGSYWEFLGFDTLNALIIILGVSEVLTPFGISYYALFHPVTEVLSSPYVAGYAASSQPTDNTPSSLIFWIGVIRSLWEGKFILWNRIPGSLSITNLWKGKGAKMAKKLGREEAVPPREIPRTVSRDAEAGSSER
jgi:hypothetical protein